MNGENPRADEFQVIPDPLTTDEQRSLRDVMIEERYPSADRPTNRDLPVLSEMYIYLRHLTLVILDESLNV